MSTPVNLLSRLALSASELAEALGVSERLVRDLQSEIPHTWLGRRVVFPVDQVREWLAERCATAARDSGTVANELLRELGGRS